MADQSRGVPLHDVRPGAHRVLFHLTPLGAAMSRYAVLGGNRPGILRAASGPHYFPALLAEAKFITPFMVSNGRIASNASVRNRWRTDGARSEYSS